MNDIPGVAIRGVTKSFGAVRALESLDLDVRAGRILCLLGPSGCGKTTALRLIAGFEHPDSGTVEINGRRVAAPGRSVPPEQRRVGMVFQDFALFPHMNVRQNVAYGISREPDRDARVDALLEMVALTAHAERMPHQLSGGMQQRVAVARALARRPEVILLDEPFSNLDQALRTQLRADVRQILRQADATAVFVTHDQEEALSIADDVCVMSRGRVEQCATPELIYAEPANPFVASFVGVTNLVHAVSDGSTARTAFGPVRLVGPARARPAGRVMAVLRPEHFEVHQVDDNGGENQWRVIDRRFSGAELLIEAQGSDGTRLWCEAGPDVRRLSVGNTVSIAIKYVETVAFPVGPRARVKTAG
jgi:iron(III) transport system ATP-binding protein